MGTSKWSFHSAESALTQNTKPANIRHTLPRPLSAPMSWFSFVAIYSGQNGMECSVFSVSVGREYVFVKRQPWPWSPHRNSSSKINYFFFLVCVSLSVFVCFVFAAVYILPASVFHENKNKNRKFKYVTKYYSLFECLLGPECVCVCVAVSCGTNRACSNEQAHVYLPTRIWLGSGAQNFNFTEWFRCNARTGNAIKLKDVVIWITPPGRICHCHLFRFVVFFFFSSSTGCWFSHPPTHCDLMFKNGSLTLCRLCV